MVVARRAKASEKQAICKKIVALWKKRYPGIVAKSDRPVLETMLYGICLENATVAQADATYERQFTAFHDLNEVRVSAISELETIFEGMVEPEWKALRVRNLLNEIFEHCYAFEYESLRRRTLDQAQKELEKIKYLSPFVRLYTLQTVLGTHLVPVDDRMVKAAVWLGLVEPDVTVESGAAALKPAIRKVDVSAFCHYLRCFATDPNLQKAFDLRKRGKKSSMDRLDVFSAPDRLPELFADYDALAKKKARTKKNAQKKLASERTATSKKKRPASLAASKRRKK